LSAGCVASSGSIGVSAEALSFPNDQTAFDYFLGKGLTPIQAAGIVGNLDQESGVDPTMVQQPGGPGRGIAQWSAGARWDTTNNDNAKWFALEEATPVKSLQLQLDFIWYELTTFPSYGLDALQNATTVKAAVTAFQTDFEGCGNCAQSKRIAYAQNVLDNFGTDQVDVSMTAGADGGTAMPCVLPATNESGACLDVNVCDGLGGDSTPGLCPGAANIQCCTVATAPTQPSAADGGTAPDGGAGSDAPQGCSAMPGTPSPLCAAWLVLLLLFVARRLVRS
jgi:hypothetical protein